MRSLLARLGLGHFVQVSLQLSYAAKSNLIGANPGPQPTFCRACLFSIRPDTNAPCCSVGLTALTGSDFPLSSCVPLPLFCYTEFITAQANRDPIIHSLLTGLRSVLQTNRQRIVINAMSGARLVLDATTRLHRVIR